MKKAISVGTAVLATVLLLMAPGCSEQDLSTAVANNKPLVLATIKAAASRGSNEGLVAWRAKNPGAANEAGLALQKNIDTVILPYLNGGTIGTSDSISQLINSSLFVNVPPDVKSTISTASAVLDAFLPAPGVAAEMTPDQLDYLRAFFGGLDQGVTDFNTNKDLKRTWIH